MTNAAGKTPWHAAADSRISFCRRPASRLTGAKGRASSGCSRPRYNRNLISVLDNCHDAQAAREGEAAPADAAAETLCLASVQRSLVSLLGYLGVVSVELLGKTYDTVEHEGTQIEDPFQILESHGSGVVRSQPVLEVVRPLWIQQAGKKIRILRPGKVVC